ncbi:MAG: HD-GYP domain-containing protein (c-di-GMP phosphodiesterase class II) [Oceanospirillaceae bacterium]|jgi:HD-GYP domain-containing protein (c-di-GMP phosphodiesterase class II)/HAMP domain-containing protein
MKLTAPKRFGISFKLPLYLHASMLFILLTIVLGAGQVWFNYQKNTELIQEGLTFLYEKTTYQVYANLKAKYDLATNNVELLAESELVNADSLAKRLKYAPLLSKALKTNKAISSYSIGYADGDFFMIRAAYTAKILKKFSAPSNSQYIIDNVTTNKKGDKQRERVFLDKYLVEITRSVFNNVNYDPRKRAWYKKAITTAKVIITAPYLFFFLKEFGTSIALESQKNIGVVVAADISLHDISAILKENFNSLSAELMLLDEQGHIMGYHKPDQFIGVARLMGSNNIQVDDLNSPVLSANFAKFTPQEQQLSFEYKGENWGGAIKPFSVSDDFTMYMVFLAPNKELFVKADKIRWQSIIIAFFLTLATLPIIIYSAFKMTSPLRRLTRQTRKIRQFDFSAQTLSASAITEIDTLAQDMAQMKRTINHFLEMLNALASEKNLDSLLATITRQTLDLNNADAVVLYLHNEAGTHFTPMCINLAQGDAATIYLSDLAVDDKGSFVVGALDKNGPKVHRLLRGEAAIDASLLPLFNSLSTDELQVLTLPLNNRAGEATGVLCVINNSENDQTERVDNVDHIGFMQSLSGFAAVSIESKHSLKAQKDLLASFIKLIAGAIDAKSHHTAGHCSRVPVITRMLAEQVSEQAQGEFADYQLSAEQFEELDIASWLHDCGKITTPEYVVDKATKLETIYDRIHEIRMRFELLKKDVEIDYFKALHTKGNPAQLAIEFEMKLAKIDDDFAFVAHCNIGRESMSSQQLARLQQLSKITWQRTLDDTKGVSLQEMDRKRRISKPVLPVTEYLLADRPDHIIERLPEMNEAESDQWGFKMTAPTAQYNHGELHNLSVTQGTLNKEERYVINEHITQTIMMLTRLKFPRYLKNVLEIAAGHHEKMDGTGYPKALKRNELSVSTRIMAIADIFEALTARDRPYKRAKSLREALDIMYQLKRDQHIDPVLFDLFLTTGVYQRYADQYLPKQQIDAVDITKYLV